MAGRPRTMHKRVEELTARADALLSDSYSLMPKQYREYVNPSDSVGAAWDDAWGAVSDNCRSLEALRKLLAEKAGIIFGKNELIEIDGESKTLAEWSAEYVIPEQLILDRVRDGWDLEYAVCRRDPDYDRHDDESEADAPADDPPAMATPVAAEE